LIVAEKQGLTSEEEHLQEGEEFPDEGNTCCAAPPLSPQPNPQTGLQLVSSLVTWPVA